MDLYGRLEELQGMTRLLIDDVGRLQGELGAGDPDPSPAQETNRRFYIRAVFALVEAALRCSGVPPADEELVVLLAGAMDVVSAWVGGGERGN